MAATASPSVSSTIGLKDMVIAPLLEDTEETLTYGDLQRVAGAVEASVSPENADPDVQYADDIEFDVIFPDPELTFTTTMADIPLSIQEMIFGNTVDDNGVLIRSASDQPPYFAVGFKSEKANHKYRYVWLFKVRAKPVTENYATKEGTTINRQTGEIEWTAVKRTHDGFYQAIADEDENGFTPENGKAFLESVYEPNIVPEGSVRAPSVIAESADYAAFGKEARKLQTGVTVSGNTISGKLFYVNGYSTFHSSGTYQNGNYLALKVNSTAGADVKAVLSGGATDDVRLDDGHLVVRVTNKATQTLKITAEKGAESKDVTYDLTGLTLEAEMDAPTVAAEDSGYSAFGKSESILQKSVTVSGTAITGTLDYVTGYTGFSDTGTYQEGNFIALKAVAASGSTIEAELVGGSSSANDVKVSGIHVVARITNKSSQTLKITARKGEQVKSTTYTLSGLTLTAVMPALTVSAESTSYTAFEMAVSSLQTSVSVSGTAISGTLKKVSNYAGFNSSSSYNTGNFLALQVTAPTDATIKAELIGSSPSTSDVKVDGVHLVARIKDKSQTLRITATKGAQSKSNTYTLTGLTLSET